MYTVIIIALLFIGIRFLYLGIQKRTKNKIVTGGLVIALTALFFMFMSFWGEKLWFDNVEFAQRFWLEVTTKASMVVIGGGLSLLIVHLMTRSISKESIFYKYLALIIALIYGISWGFSDWEIILKFFNSVEAGIKEPIHQQDASFYMFELPFYQQVVTFFIVTSIISLAAVLLGIFAKEPNTPGSRDITHGIREGRSLVYSASVFFVALALDKFLARFDLLFSNWGAVSGPGWTDAHIRLPGYTITAVLTMFIALLFIIPSSRKRILNYLQRFKIQAMNLLPAAIGSLFGIILISWLLILSILPAAFQWLKVEPNEITMEAPYIKHNINLTRHAFDLKNIQEKEYPVSEKFNKQIVESNPGVFSNIRLWDWQALDAVYQQFQEIRLYYEFNDVDIDRYMIDSTYQQVMVSAREMNTKNLPSQSKTFVNKRFKYTHGYGITLTKVNEFTSNGLPNLLIKDIPPKSQYEKLKVDQPSIYYGELTNSHVIVNSKEKEFDYPSGEENIYTRYNGKGGVQISNLWRKFLFGWKFDGTRFFFSGYPSDSSRIMFNRNIKERVQKIAPFLTFDEDPYIVLSDGKLYWMLDAYTTSTSFPYSEPYNSQEVIEYQQGESDRELVSNVAPRLHGINYFRNSVKVVINAHSGQPKFYIYNDDDPIINVWQKIFPGMFKPKEEMPEDLQKHVRYPLDKLRVQGQVYAKYHMTDPRVFYNQEDIWVRATEKYYNTIKPVEPYYIMWERPGKDQTEFVLMQPFTPKNRQVMIGWIAGMSDGENYGDFLAYKFPKERRILGPQQVETKIDQDSYLSGQLSLWDQRGSNVIRGNVMAIPVGETMIYVEPIYLQSETAAYPELRLVAVMHNDKLSYAESFDEALKGIYGEPVKKVPAEGAKEPEKRVTEDQNMLIKSANQALQNYLKYTGEEQFDQAAQSMKELKRALDKLEKQSGKGNNLNDTSSNAENN
jgi:uncharacterized membrane protein (UPF0182 family)